MVADRVVLLPGAKIGRLALMGSGALAMRDKEYRDGSIWLGTGMSKLPPHLLKCLMRLQIVWTKVLNMILTTTPARPLGVPSTRAKRHIQSFPTPSFSQSTSWLSLFRPLTGPSELSQPLRFSVALAYRLRATGFKPTLDPGTDRLLCMVSMLSRSSLSSISRLFSSSFG